MRLRTLALSVAVLALNACSTNPGASALLPGDKGIMLGPETGMALDKLVYWGLYAGAAYLILDPLAPNWEVEEARLDPELVHYSLKMKRYYSGGAGEARQVFERRAKSWVRSGKFTSYQVLEYRESLDSSVLGSQRTAEGVIRLLPKT